MSSYHTLLLSMGRQPRIFCSPQPVFLKNLTCLERKAVVFFSH
uniref:Uncharacterized protein n=1 Tax=Anguilla anguilla TaxID=7936 RepID=A0A0E9WJ55_ANGAN